MSDSTALALADICVALYRAAWLDGVRYVEQRDAERWAGYVEGRYLGPTHAELVARRAAAQAAHVPLSAAEIRRRAEESWADLDEPARRAA